jgi:hypothetical protein
MGVLWLNLLDTRLDTTVKELFGNRYKCDDHSFVLEDCEKRNAQY